MSVSQVKYRDVILLIVS